MKIYFNNLNGLRFFAASMVLVSHIEQIKDLRGFHSLYNNPLFANLGRLGVVLFFVLSGFLITYLLIVEKEQPGHSISIKNFYARRVLRIWPLYFLVIFLGLLVMPAMGLYEFSPAELAAKPDLKMIIPLFILFLPNVVLVVFGGLPFLHQTWSIGTEEQFYLAWPLVIKKSTNILRSLCFIIVIYFSIKIILYLFKDHQAVHRIYAIWSTLSVVSLAFGGICAYAYRHYKDRLFKIVSSKKITGLVFLLFTALCCFSSKLPSLISAEIFSLFFGYLILSLVLNKALNFIFERKVFNYLGKISYGIYMWHPIAITLSFYLLGMFSANNFFLYLTSFSVAIVISILSYEFFEMKFLKLKGKYSPVLPQNNENHPGH